MKTKVEQHGVTVSEQPALRSIKRRAIFKSFSTRMKKSSSFQKEGETCIHENNESETNKGASSSETINKTNAAIQQTKKQ